MISLQVGLYQGGSSHGLGNPYELGLFPFSKFKFGQSQRAAWDSFRTSEEDLGY